MASDRLSGVAGTRRGQGFAEGNAKGNGGRLCRRTVPARWFVLLVAITTALGLAWPAPRAYAASYIVTSLADNTTAGDKRCTLREAILAANNAPANGDCGRGSNGDDTITFRVSGTITLGSTLPSIVSGQGALTIDGGGSITISGDNRVRVFFTHSGVDLTLRNLTISNARSGSGSGLTTQNSRVTISNCTFSDNSTTDGRGAAIYNIYGRVDIANSTFTRNVANRRSSDLADGGAIYNERGRVSIRNSILYQNSTTDGRGGAIFNAATYFYPGRLTISDSTFFINTTNRDGAGIYNQVDGVLTIRNTLFSANHASGSGGAIKNYGYLTINDSALSENTASHGAGIANSGMVTIDNSTFADNSAWGGGAILSLGWLTITNSTFSANRAGDGGSIFSNDKATIANSTCTHNQASRAGCIWNGPSGTLTITDSILSNNSATSRGGGIYNIGSTTITDSTLSNNSAMNQGGAIFSDRAEYASSSVTLGGSTLADNYAANQGGGIYHIGNSITITTTTLANNFANAQGGGLFNVGGSATIANSTLANNSAANQGGGIFNDNGGSLAIRNSTLSANAAGVGGPTLAHGQPDAPPVAPAAGPHVPLAERGGGIFVAGGRVSLQNSIVANSVAGGDCVGSLTGPTNNNLIEDSGNACGLADGVDGNLVGYDPGLGGLTGSPAYFPLNAGSPAIDAGDNAACAAPPVNNQSQNGVARPQDGDGDSAAVCDMGSYEAPTAFVPTPTATPAATDTPSPTPTPSATPSATPTPTATPTSTFTPTATATPSPTPTPTDTPTPTPTPSPTPTPVETPTPTSTPTPTPEPALSARRQ